MISAVKYTNLKTPTIVLQVKIKEESVRYEICEDLSKYWVNRLYPKGKHNA